MADNVAAQIMGTIWSLWTLATVFLVLRFYCKKLRHAHYKADDWVLVVAWLATLGNTTAITIIELGSQNASPGPPSERVTNARALTGMISVTFGITSQSLSKVSFGLTLLHFADGWTRRFILGSIVLINLFFGLGALLFWVGCDPIAKAWKPRTPGSCWNTEFNLNFGIFVSVFSGFLDLVFSLIPWKIILGLQMNKREKIGVAVAMSMGSAAAIMAFLKAAHLKSLKVGKPDPTLTVFAVGEPAVTIMAASIPFCRVLVKKMTSSRQYELTGMRASTGKSNQASEGGPSKHQVSVVATRKDPYNEVGDGESDRSILGASTEQFAHGKGITRATEIDVHFETRSSSDRHRDPEENDWDRPVA
ncbi:hypothetical protein B0I35DRAFT_513487 [Stachybotrys elegans]|uniref:Rhodopsin domain-containing protein n=1 Tax=Stachybotrys elegans TaxID=80388 RepID=A0A8K0SLQ5_9HYPO|nr:hypothetical protein B0I35DRAFT_513487 [Stachybotrys elegans]